jgi:hypothetical protein
MPIAIHSEKKKAGRHYKKTNTAFPFLTKGLKLRATFSLLPVSLLPVFSSQLPWNPPLIFKILRTSHSPSAWKIILA